jgi:hypothetical protein
MNFRPLNTSNFLSLIDLLGLKNISLKFLVAEKLYTTRAHFFFLASIEILSGLPSSMASTRELYFFISPMGVFSIKYPQIERHTKATNNVIIKPKHIV